ncbi:MAG TPA: GNAT family N-acetyltransferase [Frateuria sp.]|uniref:GNAT family N-acetyltransferase n=1 Tax=Frateuria sp. TaxID=2211372 RepID=UPI002DECFE0E|nr:GNAT family N-acetyltransferase [Frateuria sp.]
MPLELSQRIAVAVLDGEVVGFACALTDGLSNGYLSMALMAPEQRGRGVDSATVRHVTGDDPAITWCCARAAKVQAGSSSGWTSIPPRLRWNTCAAEAQRPA